MAWAAYGPEQRERTDEPMDKLPTSGQMQTNERTNEQADKQTAQKEHPNWAETQLSICTLGGALSRDTLPIQNQPCSRPELPLYPSTGGGRVVVVVARGGELPAWRVGMSIRVAGIFKAVIGTLF